MVASNDNDKRGRATTDECPGCNVYVTGTPRCTYTYTLKGVRRRGVQARPISVADDFGSRIEVRRGESVIIGTLIDDVIAELEAKATNDR